MKKRNRNFWKGMPQCSKLDMLDRPQDLSTLLACLNDPLTMVERVDKYTYSVYGPEEAILVRPFTTAISLGVLCLTQFMLLSRN